MEQALEEQRQAEASEDYKAIRRGWCLGDQTFRKELLAQMTERMGAEHYGEERLETDVEKAERIVSEEMKARRWKEADLSKRTKGGGAPGGRAAGGRATGGSAIGGCGGAARMPPFRATAFLMSLACCASACA